jgi:hypothetical protein
MAATMQSRRPQERPKVSQKIIEVKRLGHVGNGARGEACIMIAARREPTEHEDGP